MADHNERALAAITDDLIKDLGRREGNTDRPAYQMLSLIERVGKNVNAVNKVRENRNPMDTDAAHSRKVAKAAQLMREQTRMIDQTALKLYQLSVERINKEIDQQAGLVEGKFDQEIRTAFRGLSEKQRADTLSEALKNGNSEVIAAVCLGPSVLSGVDDKSRNEFIRDLRKAKAPQLLEDLDEIHNAMSITNVAREIADNLFNDSYDPKKQAEIDRAEAQAKTAQEMLGLG